MAKYVSKKAKPLADVCEKSYKTNYDWDAVRKLYLFGDSDNPQGYNLSEISDRLGYPKQLAYKIADSRGWKQEKEALLSTSRDIVQNGMAMKVADIQVHMLNKIGNVFQSYSSIIEDVVKSVAALPNDEEGMAKKMEVVKHFGGLKGLSEIMSSAEKLAIMAKPETEEKKVKLPSADEINSIDTDVLERLLEQAKSGQTLTTHSVKVENDEG